MNKVSLTKYAIQVSKMCFGTLTMAPQQANLTPREGANLLLHAFERGVNFLDTAQYYDNYPHIALALKEWKDDIVVASKTYAYTRDLAKQAVEQARLELNRDVIDIFMLHEQESIHTLNGHREALEYLFECRQKGIIRAVGVSMHHIAAVEGVLTIPEIDLIHPLLNLGGIGIVDGGREEMEAVVQESHLSGYGVVAMKPFGGGNLFRKAGDSLNYLLNLPYVDSIAVGMQHKDEIDANIEFFESGEFSSDALSKLNSKERRLLICDWCEGCGRCSQKCFTGALTIKDGKAHLERQKCVLCCYCAPQCPLACIKVI